MPPRVRLPAPFRRSAGGAGRCSCRSAARWLSSRDWWCRGGPKSKPGRPPTQPARLPKDSGAQTPQKFPFPPVRLRPPAQPTSPGRRIHRAGPRTTGIFHPMTKPHRARHRISAALAAACLPWPQRRRLAFARNRIRLPNTRSFDRPERSAAPGLFWRSVLVPRLISLRCKCRRRRGPSGTQP